MANTVKIKRSSVSGKVPTTADLQLGELAINTFDGKLFTKKDNGTASIIEVGALGGGGSSPTIGQVVQSTTAPTSGTWLQTGKYYSKASYPNLATVLGDVPDIGSPVIKSKAQIPVTCTFTNTSARALYSMATNGAAWVFGTSTSAKFIYTTDGSAFAAVPPNSALGGITGMWYLNGSFIATATPNTNGPVSLLVSSDGITWTPRTLMQSGQGGSGAGSQAVAYGAGVYVVAFQGCLFYSTDLLSFTIPASAPAIIYTKVIYANNQFIAVSSASGGRIFTSPDGINWTERTNPTTITLLDVIYANNLYIAYGTALGGSLVTSTDGITWTSRAVGGGSVTQIIYAGGLFLAATTAGIYTSSDGLTWTSRTSGLISANTISVGYVGTTFYAGSSANGYYSTSSDGTTWTLKRDISAGGFYAFFNVNNKAIGVGDMGIVVLSGGTREAYQPGLTFGCITSTGLGSRPIAYNGSNQYVAVTSSGLPIYSSDGHNWSGAPLPGGVAFTTGYGVAYLNGNYIIHGSNTTSSIATSSNGIDWTIRTTPSTGAVTAVAYGASTYAAVSGGGGIYTSTDLVTWTLRTTSVGNFNDIIFANNKFVAVGVLSGTYACATSSDGITWTSVAFGSNSFSKIIYVAGSINLFIAVGTAGAIYTSPDAVTWTSRSAGTAQFNDITYNSTSGTIVAVGAAGTIYTSTNGTTWTSRTLGETTYALGVVLWDGIQYTAFPLGTTSSVYFRSTDAITWTRSSFIDQVPIARVQWLGNKYIKVSGAAGNYISSSSDGITWKAAEQVSYRAGGFTFDTVKKVGDTYFVIGIGSNYSIVYTSTDGITFNPSRTAVRGFVAYNGTYYYSAWKGTGGSICIMRSTDGSTWTHYSDLGTDTTSTRTFAASSTVPLEMIWSNNKLSLYIGSAAISSSLNTTTIYYSSDGLSWYPANSPIGGSIGSNSSGGGAAGTDGTTILAPFSISASIGGIYRSTDGGVTWSSLITLPSSTSSIVIYSGGYWNSAGVKTSDASKITSFGATTGFTAFGSYNGYSFNITGSVATIWENSDNNTSWNTKFFTGLGNIYTLYGGYKETPIRISDKTILTQGVFSIVSGTIVNPIVEYPLFSYDTTTTFFVPQQVSGLASNEYIYAGA